MLLDRPIFIIGPGRSGSTAFFHIFSQHPQLSWLTGLLNRYPHHPILNQIALKSVDVPYIGERLLREGRLGGGEVYDFWRSYLPNFDQSPRDLRAEDVPAGAGEMLPQLLTRCMIPARPRFMTKLTGWSRIGYLKAIFPDARFINVVRDGRAVAYSYLNVDFWRGREGPDGWRWGPLTEEQARRWEAVDRSLIGLAGLNWEILMDATAEAAVTLPDEQYMIVSYERMCADPLGLFQEVTRFCEIEWGSSFERTVAEAKLANRNSRFRDKLSAGEIDQLEAILAEALPRHGYSLHHDQEEHRFGPN